MAQTSRLVLNVFNGARQPFAKPVDILITIRDGNQHERYRDTKRGNSFPFDLPFFDNFGDNCTVIVYADGYRQAGFFPVKLTPKYATSLDLMLLPNDLGYSFVNARWQAAVARYPFLAGDTAPVEAQARYERMFESQENALACFLNLGAAMESIHLQRGTPLDYIKQVRWDNPPRQDRFFAYCDAALVDQVKQAAAAGLFAEEKDSALFHPGATASWKQIQFGEANVQLTFHENEADCKTIGGVACVTVEPDIDYYQDMAAHAIFEVLPNALAHGLTDPVQVYALRWMAGRHAGVPEFAPLYTIV